MALQLDRIEWVDPATIFARSARFDLVFKAVLAKAWSDGDPHARSRALAAYLEIIRARTDFHENLVGDTMSKNTPHIYLREFRKLCDSLRAEGYHDAAPPIPVDSSYELVNGAHRLAACFAYGIKCRVAVYNKYYYEAGGSTYVAFRDGFVDEAVENFGIRWYFKYNQLSRIAVEQAPFLLRRRFVRRRILEWRAHGIVTWHWRFLRDGRVAFVLSVPEDKASEFAVPSLDEIDRIYPDSPFPDWLARARRFRWHRSWWMTQWLKYRLLSCVRHGHKRDKSLRHAREYRRRALGFARLARCLATVEKWI